MTRFADGVLKLGDLHVAESNQDMIFTWEMIEEGALPHVSGVGDVGDGRFGETFLAKRRSAARNRRRESPPCGAGGDPKTGIGTGERCRAPV